MKEIWNLKPSADGQALEITVYGYIGEDWFTEGSTDEEIRREVSAHPNATKINVRINSSGGDMFAGIAIYNVLRGHGAEVTCYVEGLAASAASIIAMAGKRVVMGTGAMMMIHDPWSIVVGSAEDMRASADMLDKSIASLVAIYQAKTSKGEDEIRAFMKAEAWFTAKEAVAEGFADEVAGDVVGATVEARGENVVYNGVPFPRSRMPGRILAMLPRAAIAPPEPVAITRDVLAAKAPDVLAALLAEGHAAGAAGERERLRQIDDLGITGHDDLVTAAKYGDKPQSRGDLAAAVLLASKGQASARLKDRREESAEIACIRASSPEATDYIAAERERAGVAKTMADAISARRGGK